MEFKLKEIVMLLISDGTADIWKMLAVTNSAIRSAALFPLSVVKFAATIVCPA
jgi:hypothetical protein